MHREWPRQLVLPVGLAVTEATLVHGWALLVATWLGSPAGQPLLSFASILGLLVASQAATGYALASVRSAGRERGALALLGLAAALVAVWLDHYRGVALTDPAWLIALGRTLADSSHTLSPVVAALAVGLALWWRGIIHGRGTIDSSQVERSFRRGVVALVVLLLSVAAAGGATYDALRSVMGRDVLGFFFAGLVTLSLARLEAVRAQERARGGATPAFSRQWLGAMTGVVVLILGLTLALGQIVAVDLVAGIVRPALSALASGLATVVFYLMLPFAVVLFFLIQLVFQLLRRPAPPAMERGPQGAMRDIVEQVGDGTDPLGLPSWVWWVVVALVALIALRLIALAAVRRPTVVEDADVVEERESVATWRDVLRMLLAWLMGFWQRPAVPPLDPAVAPRRLAAATPDPAMTVSIREAYRQVLRLAAGRGIRRNPAATVTEHLPNLRAALDPDDDLVAMTDLYGRARYGPDSPTADDAANARERLERILAASAESSEPVDRPER